ncbi:MAG: hypothetical protein NOF05_13190 [Candidatus Accumulibacter phosphatis]|uniref:Uncharacterized protein n=1 Tax=Candidatus Accumulibacter cognatus TaxID=2954383 RepID=A0A7D5NA49_9PROT|nr:hypothetical protein [Candidatus Accumulibacter phosphatis]QLH49734.1 MAG: hypothetical protein HWD57_08025 [Candidatus Accumulibacter cognatus]
MTKTSESSGGDKQTPKKIGLNLDQFFKPATSVQTSLGTLYLYHLRASDLDSLRNLPEGDPVNRIRAFLPLVASLTEAQGFKDERPPLSPQELSRLSSNELDSLAERYVEKMLHSPRRDSSPQRPKREEGELAIVYLDRLLTDEAAVQSQQLRELHDKMLASTNSIFDEVRASTSTLGKTLSEFDRLTTKLPAPEPSSLGHDSFSAINRQFERQARERAEELEMVRLTGQMTAQSAQTLKNLAEAATVLLEQMEARDKKTDRTTRKQISIAVWAVAVSAVLALLALFVSVFAYYQDKDNNNSEARWQRELLGTLRESNLARARAEQDIQSIRSSVAELKTQVKAAKTPASAALRANDRPTQ